MAIVEFADCANRIRYPALRFGSVDDDLGKRVEAAGEVNVGD